LQRPKFTYLIESLPDLSDLLVVSCFDLGDLDGVGLLDGGPLRLQVSDLDVSGPDGVDVGSKAERKSKEETVNYGGTVVERFTRNPKVEGLESRHWHPDKENSKEDLNKRHVFLCRCLLHYVLSY